ncbi:MAG: hypothetical protein GY705_30385 [Bacteroidetes bacterium]|nr:hypothetical protein [Bacteroidota bacterium]
MAVFTLPPEMIVFYKKHIEYITEHAVDPDKRRYATKHEGVRHFIDIDHWGEYPFPDLPRDWVEALMKYTDVYVVNEDNDTLHILGNEVMEWGEKELILKSSSLQSDSIGNLLSKSAYKTFFKQHFMPQYYEDVWRVSCDSLQKLMEEKGLFSNCTDAFALDRFSEYGIVPYYLNTMHYRLVRAFKEKDVKRILRLSAEYGHYIGDASTPLHTTENYNGQLSGQVGIHAFWESRIPELFADDSYDFFVGKAEYIDQTKNYFWDIVLESHAMVDSVLAIEKALRNSFPSDKQYCYEERLGRTIRTQCQDFAAAYEAQLQGQVEQRMRDAILSIGSAWLTAWVDAGQPDLTSMEYIPTKKDIAEEEEVDAKVKSGKIFGRLHRNY